MTALWVAEFMALVLAGLLLAVGFVLIDRGLARYAGNGRWPGTLYRFFPMTALALLGVHVVLLSGQLLIVGGHYAYAALVLLSIALVCLLRPLRDVLVGAVLRAEGSLEPGGIVAFDGSRGRIRRLGIRSFEMDGPDGSVERIPYAMAARGRLGRLASEHGIAAHTFAVKMPADSVEVFREHIRLAVLNHPCTPVRRPPVMRILSANSLSPDLEVTVYSASPEHAARVEGTVRRLLAKATA